VACIITIKTTIPGSKIFRFEYYWVAHRGFHQVVKHRWSKPTYKGNNVANLNAKFKRLRYDLKFWNKSISRLTVCIQNSNNALLELDIIEDSIILSIVEAIFRIFSRNIKLDYWNIKMPIGRKDAL
jgi:hypothetical protein